MQPRLAHHLMQPSNTRICNGKYLDFVFARVLLFLTWSLRSFVIKVISHFRFLIIIYIISYTINDSIFQSR